MLNGFITHRLRRGFLLIHRQSPRVRRHNLKKTFCPSKTTFWEFNSSLLNSGQKPKQLNFWTNYWNSVNSHNGVLLQDQQTVLLLTPSGGNKLRPQTVPTEEPESESKHFIDPQ